MFSVREPIVVALPRRGSTSVGFVRVGTVYDSDVKALDEEMSALDDRIRASIKLGVNMSDLLASHTVLEESWREWLAAEGYDENLKQPWYRSDTLGPEGERAFEDFKDRERSFEAEYARTKASWDAGYKATVPDVSKIPPVAPPKSSDRPSNSNTALFVVLGLVGAGLIALKLIA